MKRLIDTITYQEFADSPSKTKADLRDRLENLFAPPSMWYDNITPNDPSTWVLCFVSNYSKCAVTKPRWVARRYRDSFGPPENPEVRWEYARPISPNECYQEEVETIVA